MGNRALIMKLKAFTDKSNYKDTHFLAKTRQLELHPNQNPSYTKWGFKIKAFGDSNLRTLPNINVDHRRQQKHVTGIGLVPGDSGYLALHIGEAIEHEIHKLRKRVNVLVKKKKLQQVQHIVKQQDDLKPWGQDAQVKHIYNLLLLSATKWRVNRKVLGVVDRICASGGRLADLVDRDDVPVPEELDKNDETDIKKTDVYSGIASRRAFSFKALCKKKDET
ncbi:hypothetical protein L1987_79197 [Smallanthus sonchifolius]|uniref:Uncharacterized protein n=1 Tax=Smallanthus sonchifolius TaxID=185202 RepID=A0ACB8ZDV3_9ASTR|nr:hypothetical protein L1987_79197 [Smallanthus sonchifolius]